jgi:uroporphyrinogen-III synthase
MTILVTRPEPAAAELVSRLHALGKQAWSLPLIEFAPGVDLPHLPQKLADLQPGDLVFILSQHSVSHYAQHSADGPRRAVMACQAGLLRYRSYHGAGNAPHQQSADRIPA